LIHPLFLSGSYLINSVKSAALFLLPGDDIAINMGMAALLFMMSLLVITFYVNLPYQLWLLTHKFLGIAFFMGTIHAFLIPSDISRDPLLRIYMFSFMGIGIIAYLFRTVLGRFFVRRFPYIVSSVRKLRDNVVEISLTPNSQKKFDYLPGQFIFVSFSQPLSEVHPFSLSSAPGGNLIFAAKVLGDYTNKLATVPLGSEASVEGPFGRFSYFVHHNQKQVWIAGGIGITPFVSMARSLNPRISVDLYYTVSDNAEAAYMEELTRIAGLNPGLRVFLWATHQKGRLTGQIIKDTSLLDNQDIFICGPPQMMYSLKQQLRKLGMSGRHIHTEEFQML
ncbi:MAG: FAD-binding oxidoreductase, partial [Patescibacteria group bacterium]